MITLPPEMMIILTHFAPEFSERVWAWGQILVAGAILAPGKRTVTSALRVMGLSEEKQIQNYHRVLNRAKWWEISIPWYGGKKRKIEIATGLSLWHTPGFDPLPIRWVLARDPLGEFKPTAFFSTDQTLAPLQILTYFTMRWGLEVTFEEARAHLGLETQRQWSDLAVARTTPALLGLFSLITLLAHRLTRDQPLPVRTAAWYQKQEATFSDVIALVRRYLWMETEFAHSPAKQGLVQFPSAILAGLVDTICYST